MIPIKDNNPTSTFPFVTILLIAINILIFIFQYSLGPHGGERFVIELGMIPYEITHLSNIPSSSHFPPLLTIFTAMFIHGGLMHLIGNMLYLWIFGNNIEDACGHFRFVIFYLICGFIASFVHVISAPNSLIPTIGASGAIAGILGAYMLLYPNAQILTIIPIFYFIRIIYLPAMLLLGFWIAGQIAYALFSPGGGIAWFAHIGGFVAGLILIKFFTQNKNKKSFIKDYPYYY